MIWEEGVALELTFRILKNAKENGASCLVTICPLCHTNLDAYQGRAEGRFKERLNLPVLFLPQLIGYALGIDPKGLGIDKNIVSAERILTGAF